MAKKKPLTTEQKLKALNKRKTEIVEHLAMIKSRTEKQNEKFGKELEEVNAKIAALTASPLPPPDPVPA